VPVLLDRGRCGMLVQRGDADGLAEGCLRLLSHPEDRQRLSSAGKARVTARFSREAMHDGVRQMYDIAAEALERRARDNNSPFRVGIR
jgi:glycosyltransferase involved in cell wall biosynthesis